MSIKYCMIFLLIPELEAESNASNSNKMNLIMHIE
jgi:hypothetical protein